MSTSTYTNIRASSYELDEFFKTKTLKLLESGILGYTITNDNQQ